MTTRQSRSASIPIPRSSSSLSPSRSIESVISIPLVPSRRPRITSSQFPLRTNPTEGHRGLGITYDARGSSSFATVTSPTTRPMSISVGSSRSSMRNSSFEPRIVRVTGGTSRSTDPTCLPSTSPSRTRRASGASGRATSAQRLTQNHSLATVPPPVSFPRPAYLDHSVLRHMLQTETPPSLPLSRRAEQSVHERHIAISPFSDSDDESNVSPPRELPPPSLSQDQILKLPTRWSDQYRLHFLSISVDGRELSFHGTSCTGDRDAAAARTDQPIPPACGVYYYEVEITNKGQKGHISIGFAARDVKLSRLPGWETNSWGYHGDNGRSFAADKTGSGALYGPTFGTGDVVGCGIDFTTHRAFFTKNGTLIGPVFENIGNETEIYPSVGMRHSGEHIRVNFGHEPFKFDIDYHVQQQRSHVWAKIFTTPLRPSLLDICFVGSDKTATSHDSVKKGALTDEQTRTVINQLVLSYLEHYGYAKTMLTFQKQLGKAVPAPSVDTSTNSTCSDRDINMIDAPSRESEAVQDNMERRTRIVNSVIAGDIDSVIVDTRTHYPDVLEAEEGLVLFKLRCRKFVELILEAAELKKQMRDKSVGKIKSEDNGAVEEMDGLDEDGMGMDVDDEDYADPSSSPCSAPPDWFGSAVLPDRGSRRRCSTSRAHAAGGSGVGMVDVAVAQYEKALNEAISYGQTLSKDYKDDARPEVKQIFKRTFAIVAWEDPTTTGGVITEIVGHEARVALAHELNKAILKSQGRPTDPVLEMLYRHTAICISQLGLLGVGGAAFADMQKEFLEE